MPIISYFPMGSSVGSGLALSAVSNVNVIEAYEKVYIKWTDPEDIVAEDNVLAKWEGTVLVRKAGSEPTDRRDGTIVIDNTVRNSYSDTYFCDTGLTNGVTYYYKFFSYTENNRYTNSEDNVFRATPNTVVPNNVSGISTSVGDGKIKLIWQDPEDVVVDGITVSTWAGTKVVYSETGYPTSPEDGIFVTDSVTKNAYWASTLVINGLTNDKTYYISLFPYSTDGAINYNAVNRISAVPDYIETLLIPNQAEALTYNGSSQSPTWGNYHSNKMIVSGTTNGTNAGNYIATFTLREDYVWADGTTEAKSVTWTIGRQSIPDVPSQNDTLAYTGYSQSPTWNGYDSSKMSISGTTSGVNAGTYYVSFTPLSNYQWSDGSVNAKSVAWTIYKATAVTVPSQSGTLTYTGSLQTPTWNDYDSEKLSIGGVTKSTNAGTYNATFTPLENYQWSDGTVAAKSVSWTINKATGSLSISPTTLTLNDSAKSGTITVTCEGDGVITAVSSNTSVATVSVNENIVTVNNVNETTGTATITVSMTEGTNYAASADQTCAVTCQFLPVVGTALNDMSWEDIRKISDKGLAANYFSAGNRKAIKLSGTVGNLSLNGTYYAYIIGIDHNSSKEGTNRIHFQFGYSALSGGVHLAFTDGAYGNNRNSGTWLHMSIYSSNAGGWNSSRMRTVVCPAFKNAMPSDLKSVLKTVTKYSDNTGNGSDAASYVTATTDTIFLLAEFEVYGTRKYANSAEKNYQAQYAYYSAGNSKVRYRHSATTSAAHWLLRSTYAISTYAFCLALESGGASSVGDACISYGFAPAFCV